MRTRMDRCLKRMAQGREQQAAYEGRGLRAEEYSVMVIIAKHQERLAKAA